jgi:hypothetical protein
MWVWRMDVEARRGGACMWLEGVGADKCCMCVGGGVGWGGGVGGSGGRVGGGVVRVQVISEFSQYAGVQNEKKQVCVFECVCGRVY